MSVIEIADPPLATPTAFTVTTAPAHDDEWFAARRAGITATDLPKILGLSHYGNATSVWADKLGLLPWEPTSEAAQWGLDLEDLVATRWAERTGAGLEGEQLGILARVDRPEYRATPDYLVTNCPDAEGPCILQVKTRSAFTGKRWRDDVPDDVLAQVTWEMVVTGYRHCHVACLLGGQKLLNVRVDLDGPTAVLCMREADRVWAAVQSGQRPVDDPTDTLARVLDSIYTDRTGRITELETDTAAALLANYADALSLEATAKEAKAKARAALIDALGNAELAVAPDPLTGDLAPAFAYREVTRRGYTVKPSTYRQISILKDA